MDALRLWWLQDQYEIYIVTKILLFSLSLDDLVGYSLAFHPRGMGSIPRCGDETFSKIQRHGYITYTIY